VVSEFYAYAGFFSVLLVLGLETGYFRFRQKQALNSEVIYAHALSCVLILNLIFLTSIIIWQQALADWMEYPLHPEYLSCFAGILAIDSLTALPFARLRAENRAWQFAGIKLSEIVLTLFLNLVFLVWCPKLAELWPDATWVKFYDATQGITYIFLANLIASFFKLLLLIPLFLRIPVSLNPSILFPLLRYSLPMVIIGFAGMVNEMLDRVVLKQLLPYDLTTNLNMLGIYGACYKLSILMSLFVQAFRYAGEPFFFAYANRSDAKQSYALIMQYFVLTGIFIFLLVTLYIDFFQYFIGTQFRAGLEVVPILLLANLFLGIYVNLSIWYKLSDKTGLGAWVSLLGAALTIGLNIWWIPKWGYLGSAWATLACYFFMTCLSWLLGQLYYPVAYPVGKISLYLLLAISIYFLKPYLITTWHWNVWLAASFSLFIYLFIVGLTDIRPLIKRK
jgi:O-antigen/teichoic acid export membrane protein